MSTITVIIIAK